MTTNQTLRLPGELARQIDNLRGNMPRHEWIVTVLKQAISDADPSPGDVVIGTIQMQPGEVVPDCVMCNHPTEPRAILHVIRNEAGRLNLAGPLCPACANTD